MEAGANIMLTFIPFVIMMISTLIIMAEWSVIKTYQREFEYKGDEKRVKEYQKRSDRLKKVVKYLIITWIAVISIIWGILMVINSSL